MGLAAVACSSSNGTNPKPSQLGIRLVSGSGQSAVVGTAVPQPLIVLVTNDNQGSVPNQRIDWVVSGGGKLQVTTSTSDSSGLAQNTWTLGHIDTIAQRALVRVHGMTDTTGTVTFTATATPGAPVAAAIVSGNNQPGYVYSPLPDSIVLRVTDQYGNGVGGQRISWCGFIPYNTGGGGTLYIDEWGYALGDTITSSTGIAKAQWTVGPRLGAEQCGAGVYLGAYVNLNPSVIFATTVTPKPPVSLTVVSGSSQRGLPGSALPMPAVVQLLDADGHDFPATVSFHVQPPNGTMSGFPVGTPYGLNGQPMQGTDSVVGFQTDTGIRPNSTVEASWTIGFGPSTMTVTAPGAQPITFTATPIALQGTSIAAGRANCVVTPPGLDIAGVDCWGAGSVDLQGTSGLAQYQSVTPVEVPGLINPITTVTSGPWGPCALTTAGEAFCWGEIVPLTLSSGNEYEAPTAISGVPPLVQIVEGGDSTHAHRCLLTTTGSALCYGQNQYGQVGDGTTADSVPAPTAVAGGLTFTTLAAGGDHSCGIVTGGAVYCWGSDSAGQLGDGAPASFQPSPVLVSGLTAIAITAGFHHTCAVTSSGAAWCWGANNNGQLGDGTNITRTKPVAVSGGLTFTTVAAGGDMTCALTTAKLPSCWGTVRQSYSQPGPFNTPIPIGIVPMTAIAVSGLNGCGLTTNGWAACWGDPNGAGSNTVSDYPYSYYAPVGIPPVGGIPAQRVAHAPPPARAPAANATRRTRRSTVRRQPR